MADSVDGHEMEAEAEDWSILASALRQLTPKQRSVLYLRFCEDTSEIETADTLGRAVGTVRSQAHDALA
jgi:RNA polymerase sigma factor (sigma-70 family)